MTDYGKFHKSRGTEVTIPYLDAKEKRKKVIDGVMLRRKQAFKNSVEKQNTRSGKLRVH